MEAILKNREFRTKIVIRHIQAECFCKGKYSQYKKGEFLEELFRISASKMFMIRRRL